MADPPDFPLHHLRCVFSILAEILVLHAGFYKAVAIKGPLPQTHLLKSPRLG